MSHTRSAIKSDGSFDVEVRDYAGMIVHAGNYPNAIAARDAAQHWERLVTIGLVDAAPVASLDDLMMSDDELLRELLA